MSPTSERSWLTTGRPASASTTVKNATKIDGTATGSIIHTLRSTIALRSCKPILTARPRMMRCVQLRDGNTGVRMIGAWPWAPSSAVPIPSSAVPFARAGSGGALGFRCGAGTPRLLAWQAWHLETSIFVSRGRCGTWWHRLLLWRGRRGTYGTGLALVARLVLGVAPGRRGCWRGRRGTWKHPSSFHVAGVVVGDIDFYSGVAGVALIALGWLWWRAWF